MQSVASTIRPIALSTWLCWGFETRRGAMVFRR
jgi:hypothetical protein